MTVQDAQADPILKANFPEYYPDKHGKRPRGRVGVCVVGSGWIDDSCGSIRLIKYSYIHTHVTHTSSINKTDRELASFHRRMAAGPADVAQRFKVWLRVVFVVSSPHWQIDRLLLLAVVALSVMARC